MMICLRERSQMNRGVFSYLIKTNKSHVISVVHTGRMCESTETTLRLRVGEGNGNPLVKIDPNTFSLGIKLRSARNKSKMCSRVKMIY